MTYSIELKKGSRVEREHLGTYRKLKAYHQKHGKCMSDKQFTESIAKDHLNEDKNYYEKLKKAKL